MWFEKAGASGVPQALQNLGKMLEMVREIELRVGLSMHVLYGAHSDLPLLMLPPPPPPLPSALLLQLLMLLLTVNTFEA